MDKQRLYNLLNDPNLLTESDYKELNTVKKTYPYFQATLPLLVVAAEKFDKNNYKNLVQSAAIYSFDRKHLKAFLNDVKKEGNTAAITLEQDTPPKPFSAVAAQEQAVVDHEHLPDSFYEELFEEMEKLKNSKAQYNSILSKLENETVKKLRNTTKKQATKAPTTKKTVVAKSKATTDPKSKTKASTSKPKIAAKAKATTTKVAKITKTAKIAKVAASKTKSVKVAKATPKAKVTKTAAPKKDSKTKASTAVTAKKKPQKNEEYHTIIDEIKLKQVKVIDDAHLMEQINLITNFIEKEPSLNKKMVNNDSDAKGAIEDLSETSTQLSDDVISETLAKLMIKQGRKEKAMDIYKKLIWKFPQKKSYFAAEIKKLKSEE